MARLDRNQAHLAQRLTECASATGGSGAPGWTPRLQMCLSLGSILPLEIADPLSAPERHMHQGLPTNLSAAHMGANVTQVADGIARALQRMVPHRVLAA
jgi:hypothetical protein